MCIHVDYICVNTYSSICVLCNSLSIDFAGHMYISLIYLSDYMLLCSCACVRIIFLSLNNAIAGNLPGKIRKKMYAYTQPLINSCKTNKNTYICTNTYLFSIHKYINRNRFQLYKYININI